MLSNFLLTFIEEFRMGLQSACIGAMWFIGIGYFFYVLHDVLENHFKASQFLRSRFVKPLAMIFFSGMSFYVISKPHAADGKNVGADSSILLKEVDIEYNNETHHNNFTIAWTNDVLVADSTPFAYRHSTSNDWIDIQIPANYTYTVDPIDSNLRYISFEYTETTNDMSNVSFWWVGTDRPSVEIVVVSDDLNITVFQHDSEHLYMEWSITEEIAQANESGGDDTYYTIQYSDDNGKTWVDCAVTQDELIDIPGFWYGKDRLWRVMFIYDTGRKSLSLQED